MTRRRRKRNRKRKLILIRFLFIIILFLLAIYLIQNAFAKYRSSATSDAGVELAYYFAKVNTISQDLKLESILPRSQKYVYDFSVANYDGNDRTETALSYTMQLKTTTNLQLNYSVHKRGENVELITNVTREQDDDGTYFQYIDIQGDSFGFSQNEIDYYQIEVEFPTTFNSAEYEGIVEYLQLSVSTSQIVQ